MVQGSQILCPKCGRTKAGAGKGSLTQWIVACRCDLEILDEAEDLSKFGLCSTCGKKISDGREGSLTQWVLRSDLCSCKHPLPVPVPAQEQRHAETEINDEDEPELPLDPATFPTERYKPLSEIGQGTTGQVYLCRDRLLRKPVAVKCLKMVTKEQLVMFQKEAKATSQLNHPGVINVLDFGATTSGAPYMVMEFIQGTSLQQHLQDNGPMPEELAIKLFAKLAATLSYVHEKGIFHRDLKSSNILVTFANPSDPDLKIIDFGVAGVKQSLQEPTIVQGRTIVGTPAYMPPDQAFGLQYDERSEIYSLGCVMFETLTGRVPFIGETTLETISMHANADAPKLIEAAPDATFSDQVQSVVSKCLEKQREFRFNSMGSVFTALYLMSNSQLFDLDEIDKPTSNASDSDREAQHQSKRAWRFAGITALALFVIGSAALLISSQLSAERESENLQSRKENTEYLLDPGLSDAADGLQIEPEVIRKPIKSPIDSANSLASDVSPLQAVFDNDRAPPEVKNQLDRLRNANFYKTNDPGRSLTLKGDAAGDEALMTSVVPTLIEIKIEKGHYTRIGIACLKPLKKLRMMSVEVDALEDDAFAELCQLPALEQLRLEIARPLSATRAANLKNLPRLSKLILQRSHHPGVWREADLLKDDRVIPRLGKCERLKTLQLVALRPKDQDFAAIQQYLNLTELIVEEQYWPPHAIDYIEKMSTLKRLDVRICPRGVTREALIGTLSSRLKCELVTFNLFK